MALSAAIVWEVRGGAGNNNNGGGFKAGASGTDRSQQNSAHVFIDGSTITATVHTTTTQITISGYTVATADVGNVLQITGGTATAGWYEITAVDTGNNRWTLDRSAGTAAQTVVGRMGGAMDTLSSIIKASGSPLVAGNIIYAKASGDYAELVDFGAVSGTTTARLRLVGYSASRGDGLRATVTGSNSRASCCQMTTASRWLVENFLFTSPVDQHFRFTDVVQEWTFINCRFTGGASATVVAAWNSPTQVVSYLTMFYCEIDGTTTYGIGLFFGALIYNCYIHDNAFLSAYITSGVGDSSIVGCVFRNNGYGVYFEGNSYGTNVINNTIDGSGTDGILIEDTVIAVNIFNNLITNSGGYGINCPAAHDGLNIDYNAFYNNTSGARSNVPTGPHDVLLTSSPYLDRAGLDYRLNNNAGGGGSIRGIGAPNAFTGLAAHARSYQDIGALQHQDPPPAPRTRPQRRLKR